MSKVVKYVATIEESTGRIMNVEFPQATLKPEGTTDGMTVIHITEDNMPEGFMNIGWNPMLHFWDGETFIHVGAPPNRHAIYNGTDWEWDQELLVSDVRTHRDRLLAQSDWTQMPDAPFTEEEKTAWQAYRQELRDFMSSLPNEFDSVQSLSWPIQP